MDADPFVVTIDPTEIWFVVLVVTVTGGTVDAIGD